MSNNKVNCWQHLDCGRESGGKKTAELGVWHLLSTNAVAPSGTQKVRVLLYSGATVTGVNYLDDVTLSTN